MVSGRIVNDSKIFNRFNHDSLDEINDSITTQSSSEIFASDSITTHRVVHCMYLHWRAEHPQDDTFVGSQCYQCSIYETPDWDGPVGGSSRGQLMSVEWDGPCPALIGTLNFRF